VPVADGGDRVSSPSAPYQTAFTVTTDVENGQTVSLDTGTGTLAYAVVKDQIANFSNVTLASDKTYTLSATCNARSGATGTSGAVRFPVDTTPPILTAQKGTGSNGSDVTTLANGDHWGPLDDADGIASNGIQLKLCGTTTSSDAIDLPSTLGNAQNNFCVKYGESVANCAKISSSGACVNLNCPGNGPFSLKLILKDEAGNPVTETRTGLTCASEAPQIDFLDPVDGSATGYPLATRLLANKDLKTGATTGFQYNVRACTNAEIGQTVKLYGSAVSIATSLSEKDTNLLAQTTVTANSGNACPSERPNLITFAEVTLPESTIVTDDSNSASWNSNVVTRLSIEVLNVNNEATTRTALLWVDSQPPNFSLYSPAQSTLCGQYFKSATVYPVTLTYSSTIESVITTIKPIPPTVGDVIHPPVTNFRFGTRVDVEVEFPQGTYDLSAIVKEPSGNESKFPASGPACTVEVGDRPSVTFQNPIPFVSMLTASTNTLPNALTDEDPSTAGWQGSGTAKQLRVVTSLRGTDASSATIQFAANGSPIGTARPIDPTTGIAFLNVTGGLAIPEGAAVEITAETSATLAGPGKGSVTVPVDVTKPLPPTGYVFPTITEHVRRETSFKFDVTAFDDPTSYGVSQPIYGFDVRVSETRIDTPALFDKANVVNFDWKPERIGDTATVYAGGLLIQKGYYFAIAAYDAVGNRSDVIYTDTPKKADFELAQITQATTAQNFGWAIDATEDVNGDGLSDLIVGHQLGKDAYIYLGKKGGVDTTAPSVHFSNGALPGYGSMISIIGDIDKDGLMDIAIGSYAEGTAGAVYVFRGRTAWPAELTPSAADWTITADTSTDGKYASSWLGFSITRLGDFNGDGVDDFAIGVPKYGPVTFESSTRYQGQVAVIYGVADLKTDAVVLPGHFGTRATRIDGDPTSSLSAAGRFGYSLLGIGRFYGSAKNPAVIVSEPYYGLSSTVTNVGKLYSFRMDEGLADNTPGSIPISKARHTMIGTEAAMSLGSSSLVMLGNFGPGGQSGVGLTFPKKGSPSYGMLLSGTSTNGPFAQQELITTTEISTNREFARFMTGGAAAGSSTAKKLIGSDVADLVISTQAEPSTTPGVKSYRLFIIDGEDVAMTGTADAATLASKKGVTLVLPAPTGETTTPVEFARQVSTVGDTDGDGYADIVVGYVGYGTTLANGRVLIYR
jgi:hypothetical protein